jgi:hypothetical protein
MVVGPGLFKTMSKQLDWLGTLWSPDQKAGRRSTEAADHPQNILHCVLSMILLSRLTSGW